VSDRATISVVIPARDDGRDLGTAITSVLAQDVPEPLDVVIAVAPSLDDTSTVASAMSASDTRVRVVANPAGCTSCGLNAGIAVATGDVIVRVDARSVLPPGYIARAVETLSVTGAGNVGGMQLPVGRTSPERAIAVAMRSPIGAGGARYRTGAAAGPVDTVYLGVFRRDALEAVGGFDESLDRNQDYELNWRLREAGWQVWFDPALRVEYRPRGSLRALATQYAGYGRWKCEVLRRHPASARVRQLMPPIAVAVLAASMAALPWASVAAAPIGVYVAAIAVGGVASGRSEPVSVRVRVPAALAVMHLSWGGAFLVELLTRSLRRARSRSATAAGE
jgi:glycosyltransferase involved in cell wall biosynthesis